MTEHATPVRAPAAWTKMLGDLTRPPEESRAFRAASLAAVVIAALAVISNDVGGAWLWFLALAVIPAGAVTSYVRRNDTSPVVPLILTIVTIGLVVRFVTTNANPTSPGELRVPLAELLVMLEGVRAFSLRSRREVRFALASSLALIAVAGALSISMAFAAYAALWGASAILALALGHRSELAELVRAPHGAPRPAIQLPVRAIVASLLSVLALGTAAFLVVPAAKSSKFLAVTSRLPNPLPVPNPGGLSNPSLGRDNPAQASQDDSTGPSPESFGYFGFSKTLDTSLRGRPDETLVMRVRSSAPDFWRGQTFDTWDGRVWSLSDERTVPVTGATPLQILQPSGEPPVAGEDLIQTVSLEVSGPNLIFAANQPIQLYIPQSTVFETTDGAIRTGVELDRGAIYTVVSRRSQATAARLRATGTASESSTPQPLVDRYTRLPQVPARVRELATELTAGQLTTYDKVKAIERWMGDNTKYSLDIPPLPPGEDAVERFLFEDKIGFCEQIASSLVVMLRSQGIPARLAVGYTPGERNPFTGLYEVRAKDAHAWAEVYFPGFGWQGFDPTAQVPLAGDAPPDAARVGLRDYLAKHLPGVPMPVVIAMLVAVGIALWWRPLAELVSARRRRRSWAETQFARVEKLGAKLGRERSEGETVREYADALERSVLRDARVGEVADALTADVFDDATLPQSERERVETLIGAMERDV